MTDVRRSPEGRIALHLDLGFHPDELPRRLRWLAVEAVDGQVHVELLDDDVTEGWEQL